MAAGPASFEAQSRRSKPPLARKVLADACVSSRVLRRSPRTKKTAIERSEPQTTVQDSTKEEIHGRTIQTRKRTRVSQTHTSTPNRSTKKRKREREAEVTSPLSVPGQNARSSKRIQSPESTALINGPQKRLRTRDRSAREQEGKRPLQEVQVTQPRVSPDSCAKRAQAPTDQPVSILKDARVSFWSEKGIWPTKEDESMDRFRELVENARARKRSLSRKRSNASMASDSSPTSSMSREQKCAPYRHALFETQLKECGSFMDDHELGISSECEELCQLLLKEPQPTPPNTLFSDDGIFKKTCKRLKGENETKVILRISQLIVPSAEILADQGDKHLAILRETTNACWVLSMPFINPGSSASARGPRPQPDSTHGFDRDAFNRERLRKLRPFLGDLLTETSFFAATFQMYFPFLTCEVKCGDGQLDIADRQNAYSQSVSLLGLHKAFKLVGREEELHREINGFSVSHNDADVRIYGHYLFIDRKEPRIYRHLIAKFIFAPSGEGDQRWKAYRFVKNVYDLWLPKHFERLCSVIDMLPEVSDTDQESDSSRSGSGLSQQFENHSLGDASEIPDSQPSLQQIKSVKT